MDQSHPTDHTRSNGTTTATADPRLGRLQRRLLEAFDELWDNFVDPADALYDFDGSRWTRLGGEGIPGSAAEAPYADPQRLGEIRAQCRSLAVTNEFAINGHDYHVRKPLSRPAISSPRGRVACCACHRVPTTTVCPRPSP